MLTMKSYSFRTATFLLLSTLVFNNVGFTPSAYASIAELPQPGSIVSLSKQESVPLLKGLRFDQNDPLNISFVIEKANDAKVEAHEATTLINYFLTALTVAEEDLWVNLSPYESDRVMNDQLAETELGQQLLEQDYILKQLSASVTHPDTTLGQDYWKSIQGRTHRPAPTNAFDKIWIMPNDIEVYEGNNTAYVTKSTMKLMTDADYLALQNNQGVASDAPTNAIKDTLLPSIEDDVNKGQNFATLRQVYNAIILANWFKAKFKNSFYNFYFDSQKTKGVDLAEEQAKDKVYNMYVEAFQKGAYDIIKKEYDTNLNRKVKRHYFSGGVITPKNTNTQITTDLKSINSSSVQVFNMKSNLIDQKGQTLSSSIKSNEEMKKIAITNQLNELVKKLYKDYKYNNSYTRKVVYKTWDNAANVGVRIDDKTIAHFYKKASHFIINNFVSGGMGMEKFDLWMKIAKYYTTVLKNGQESKFYEKQLLNWIANSHVTRSELDYLLIIIENGGKVSKRTVEKVAQKLFEENKSKKAEELLELYIKANQQIAKATPKSEVESEENLFQSNKKKDPLVLNVAEVQALAQLNEKIGYAKLFTALNMIMHAALNKRGRQFIGDLLMDNVFNVKIKDAITLQSQGIELPNNVELYETPEQDQSKMIEHSNELKKLSSSVEEFELSALSGGTNNLTEWFSRMIDTADELSYEQFRTIYIYSLERGYRDEAHKLYKAFSVSHPYALFPSKMIATLQKFEKAENDRSFIDEIKLAIKSKEEVDARFIDKGLDIIIKRWGISDKLFLELTKYYNMLLSEGEESQELNKLIVAYKGTKTKFLEQMLNRGVKTTRVSLIGSEIIHDATVQEREIVTVEDKSIVTDKNGNVLANSNEALETTLNAELAKIINESYLSKFTGLIQKAIKNQTSFDETLLETYFERVNNSASDYIYNIDMERIVKYYLKRLKPGQESQALNQSFIASFERTRDGDLYATKLLKAGIRLEEATCKKIYEKLIAKNKVKKAQKFYELYNLKLGRTVQHAGKSKKSMGLLEKGLTKVIAAKDDLNIVDDVAIIDADYFMKLVKFIDMPKGTVKNIAAVNIALHTLLTKEGRTFLWAAMTDKEVEFTENSHQTKIIGMGNSNENLDIKGGISFDGVAGEIKAAEGLSVITLPVDLLEKVAGIKVEIVDSYDVDNVRELYASNW